MKDAPDNEAKAPPNTVFGRYEILSPLGGGGMASVYRASQRGPAGAVRTVALKVIHPHLSGEDAFVRMFLDEMRVAMALQHRNIVQTFDAGDVGGRQFLAMELVAGCTLRELLRRAGDAPIPLDIVLFIGAEICAALHYAHTYQPELTGQPSTVVHRDVSPSNVLLSTAGDVKLADFGVARAADKLRQQSISDAVKGKLAYMPPEQARGRAEVRSDIFALGVTLYETISGRPLRSAVTFDEVLEGPHMVPPLCDLRPEVPPELDALLASCLDPTAEGRPGSARMLEQVLREMLGALQRQDHELNDPRARLASYLAAQPPPPAGDPAAERLAQALLLEAQAMASLSGGIDVPVASTRSGVTQPATPNARDALEAATERYRPSFSADDAPAGMDYVPPPEVGTTALTRPPRSPWPFVVLALGVLTLAGFGIWVLARGSSVDQRSFAGSGFGSAAFDAEARRPRPVIARDQGVASARADQRVPPTKTTKTTRAPKTKTTKTTKHPARSRGKGKLSINATRWVRLVIDGKPRGNTPLQDLELPAGRHTVQLLDPKSGKVLKTLRLRIQAGRSTTRVIEL